jgi:hypothetical protein
MKEPQWVLREMVLLKTLALAAREFDEAGYAAWLRSRSRRA